MLRTVDARVESWPLKAPFCISRGVRTESRLVHVAIGEGALVGRGECAPSARYGEDAGSVMAQIDLAAGAVARGATREDLRGLLAPGSARSALDCALWDLDIAQGRAQLPPLRSITSAFTVSLDTPARMAVAARKLRGASLIKVKVNHVEPEKCLRAVRFELPDATLIVDANEAWSMDQLTSLQPVLTELRVAMIEQPLPAGADEGLDGFIPLVTICADESCHVTDDLQAIRRRYGMINIKLEKSGGLTEALDMVRQARAMGLGVMVGCMLGTSLSMAPAFHVAMLADFVDLDGPWWMAEDRPGGVKFSEDGTILPPEAGFWGN